MDNFRRADADPGTLLGMAFEDISGYSLRRGLGSGSAGTVWLLRDLATGRHAVLKRIPKSAVAVKTDFLADLELARTIDHPHIARLLEVRESDREWLLFSQYVAAGTLTSLLERRGTLSPGELVTLISPLAQGLSTLHQAGLTHGHLDLNDIMFDADGRPVITDAGLRTLAPPTTPEADLTALAAIAHQAGGTPQTFPLSLFTTTADHLAEIALHQSHPLPIDLGFTPDPSPPPPTPSHNQPPTPPPTDTSQPTTPTTSRLPPTTPSREQATRPQSTTLSRLSTTTPWEQPPTPAHVSAQPSPTRSRPLSRPERPAFATWRSALVSRRSAVANEPSAPSSIRSVLARLRPAPDSVRSRLTTSRPTPAGGSLRLSRPTHRRSARRQSTRHQDALQFLRTKRAAYGILAACGAGALVTVAIGLATLGVLGHPAPTSTAAADQSPPPTPPPAPTTPRAPSTPTSTTAPTPAPPQRPQTADSKKWLQTLQALDKRRSHAFSTLNPAELNTIYVPGSPPWSADRALLTSYRNQHIRIEGLRMQIEAVTVETPTKTTVVLRIVDRLISGTAITASGHRTPFPPGQPTTRRLTLTAHTTWRISAITTA